MSFAPLPISKRFFDDIVDRILEVSAVILQDWVLYKNLMNVFKAYLEGVEPERATDDKIVMALFEMVRRDVDKALERSRRARQRAAERKARRPYGVQPRKASGGVATPWGDFSMQEMQMMRVIMDELRKLHPSGRGTPPEQAFRPGFRLLSGGS